MARVLIIVAIACVITLIVYGIYKITKSKDAADARDYFRNIDTPVSAADELIKLQNLKEDGVITEEEFEKLKSKLLE